MDLEDQLGVTRTVFRVVEFLSWQRHGHLALRPPFQRGDVWSEKAKSFFIDTIIRGYPVPIVFLQDETDLNTGEAIRRVIDGQQRLRTVLGFVDPSSLPDLTERNEFVIQRTHNKDLGGKGFRQLPDAVKDRILNFEFSVHILPSATPTSVLLEVFARMNATGVKVNDQELRNARFHGELKQFVYEYAYQHVDRWLDWGVFSRSQVARMSDVEFTSELILALVKGPAGKSQTVLDDLYRGNDETFEAGNQIKLHLDAVFDLIDHAFDAKNNSEHGYGITKTPFHTQGWFYPMFVVLTERDHQLQHFDALDQKAGIVLGFAGALVALAPARPEVLLSLARAAAVVSGFLCLSTFWPRRYWSTDLRPLRDKYLAAEPSFTRLRLLDTQIDHDRAERNDPWW